MLLLVILTLAVIGMSFLQILHRKLHPFAVFVWLTVLIFQTLIFSTPVPLFLLLCSVITVKLLSRADSWNMYMRFSLYMLFFIVLFNMLLVHTGTPLWTLGPLTIYAGAIEFAYTMALRLLIIMGAFSIFSSNINTDDLFLIFEKLRVPEKAYMTFIIALRFFEVLGEDARESMLAFRARGIPVADTGLKNKIRYRYPVLASLLKNSMDRAMDIAEVLEVRGFPSSNRKAWRHMNFTVLDYAGIIATIAGAVLCVITVFVAWPGLPVLAAALPTLTAISGGERVD